MRTIQLDPADYQAVIDIGSNSVRMVVFDGIQRVPDTIFNEKILCGLGAELGATGRLGARAVEQAISTLRRFRALVDQMRVQHIHCVATAAVRDAVNGADFIQCIEQECGLQVRVLDGNEEGVLAACGVLAGAPNADGLVADLGGGSLELVRVEQGKIGPCQSLPIGPLRLRALSGGDMAAVRSHVQQSLAAIDWLGQVRDKRLYMVGGAWRNLGKLLQRDAVLPLRILQGYRVGRVGLGNYCKRLSRLTSEEIPYGSTIPSRRLEILPLAALLLRELLHSSGVSEGVFSSFGLREGLIFQQLDAETRAQDPFLFSCQRLARERGRFAEHGRNLHDWTRPLFSGVRHGANRERLHLATAMLSDIAWRGHPDYRAEKAVETILHGHFVGLELADRAFVAVALNQVYGAPIDVPEIAPLLSMLPAEHIREARVLGAALRLAQRLSGGAVEALDLSHLDVRRGRIVLRIPDNMRDLANEVVERRLRQLGQLKARSTAIEII